MMYFVDLEAWKSVRAMTVPEWLKIIIENNKFFNYPFNEYHFSKRKRKSNLIISQKQRGHRTDIKQTQAIES